MKKFLFLICLFILPLSVFWQEITRTSLKNKFGESISIWEYNISNLDADIAAPIGTEGIYDNSIQLLSKEKSWDKKKFTDFVKALKNKNTQKAKELYSKDWKVMSPFLPTCCYFKDYIAFKSLKNWILTLKLSGNWAESFYLEYIFYANNRLFSITWELYFFEEPDKTCINLDDKNCTFSLVYDNTTGSYRTENSKIIKTRHYVNWKTTFRWLMSYWFDNPDKANSYFKKEYDKFIDKMTLIWK